ncbi:MAG: ribonuclease P protein subunit [Thermoplasmata archaeon]|jgi:RNase P/RNase MRP subunit p29
MPEPTSLSRTERLALAGELLGGSVEITEAPGVRGLPINGVLVDESFHMLTIRQVPDGRTLKIAKQGLVGRIDVGGRELPLRGEVLRVRPEDRTKRLLGSGSKRFR